VRNRIALGLLILTLAFAVATVVLTLVGNHPRTPLELEAITKGRAHRPHESELEALLAENKELLYELGLERGKRDTLHTELEEMHASHSVDAWTKGTSIGSVVTGVGTLLAVFVRKPKDAQPQPTPKPDVAQAPPPPEPAGAQPGPKSPMPASDEPPKST
jgi:hypothetical protein